MKKRHGRRITSAAASNKARGKLYRKDKLALPVMLEAKRRLGKKLRERGHARRDWQSEGHDLREVKAVDWSTWHGRSPKTRKGAGGDTLLTCLTCLLVRRAQQKFKPCRGNRKVTSSQMNMWRSLSDVNRRALLEVWDMSHDEAEIVFGGAAASWRSNPTLFGHDLVELVATRKFLTCRNCWFIRQAAGKLATCTSRSKGPTKKQVATWKGLKKHHGLQLRFAEIWGVSLDEAVAWYEHSPLRNAKRRAASARDLRLQSMGCMIRGSMMCVRMAIFNLTLALLLGVFFLSTSEACRARGKPSMPFCQISQLRSLLCRKCLLVRMI